MKSIRFFVFFICIIVFSACKKDKLEGEMSILIGKWNWIETSEVRNYCESDSLWNYQIVLAANPVRRYSLEFLEKGKVVFYSNDAILWNERVVLDSKSIIENGTYKYHFVFILNNMDNNKLDVWVGQDSLLLNDFPKDTDENCFEMFNYFIRQ